MKVLQINSCCGCGSTGRIAVDLYKVLKKYNHDCIIAYARDFFSYGGTSIKIGTQMDVRFHALYARLTDKCGFASKTATKRLITQIKEYNPDIIHLHNIHGYYINIEILFDYLKVANKPIIWTLHDCWAFTGHCAHFDFIGCDKWKSNCNNCPQTKEYPASFIRDNSSWNYNKKKKLFTSVKNMTIVTPSVWLSDLIKQSFLRNYPIKIINNGIDLSFFKPTRSNFRSKYNLEHKFIVLGVAGVWNYKKGFKDFIKLSTLLDDKYRIVLVGLSKKQIEQLPSNIIGISKTNNIKELAEIYTAANVFVNPTLEDNFPTTNLEALACGTPVVTYETGGSTESINESCGFVVKKGNINEIFERIKILHDTKQNYQNNCMKVAANYNKFDRFEDYIEVYKEVIV